MTLFTGSGHTLNMHRALATLAAGLAVLAAQVSPAATTHHVLTTPVTQADGPDSPTAAWTLAIADGMTVVDVSLTPRTTVPMTAAYEGELGAEPLWSVGSMRGRTVLAISASALKPAPGSGGTSWVSDWDLTVTTAPGRPAGQVSFVRETASGSRTFSQAYSSLTGLTGTTPLPPANVLLDNSGEPHHPTFRPTVEGTPVDMVIITSDEQTTEYQALADFKITTGIHCEVRSVEWIEQNYPQGVDRAETIRNFIKDAASLWGTAYVLLGGDTEVIPVRKGWSHFGAGELIPTDLYYSNLDGTWDADGDGLFGEAAVDSVDLFPDVWIGRLPSSSAAEAQVLVDKTLIYQKSPPLGYQQEVLLLGEVLFPQTWSPGDAVFVDGAAYCQDVESQLPGTMSAYRMYENHTAYPGSVLEDKPDVISEINSGYNIVHHVGHGFVNTMAVGKDGKTLTNSDADAFTNGDETFLLYAINCTSSAIDFNCLAERFLLNPNGGAIATVGSTRLDFPITGKFYQDEFYDLLFNQGIAQAGVSMAMSKLPFIPLSTLDGQHRWTQFTMIFMGDPSLEIFTDVPAAPLVTHAPTAALGDYSYVVEVTLSGSPAESASVVLYKDGDTLVRGLTDASGEADLVFRPDRPGDFSVGVKIPGALPYADTASVVVPGTPYLFAQDQLIDDDGSGPSSGNGNGLIESGETVQLDLVLENTGGSNETTIIAQISTSDPYLTVVDNLALYPNINAGQSASSNDEFVVSVDSSAPDRYEAVLSLIVYSTEGPYFEDVLLYIHRPRFEYRRQAVRDTVGNGNGDGIISAGEDFAIRPTVRNAGLGTAGNLEARLRSSDPAVTIADSVSTLGSLVEGAVSTGDGFSLQLSDVSTYHELRLVLVDDHGERYTQLIDWTPPPTPSAAGVVTMGTENSIILQWTPVAAPDLWGYDIYRSPAASGPYSRINQVTTNNIAYFEDSGLPGLTRFYYRIAAVDTSGNSSAWTDSVAATTSLPLHPGWPVQLSTATTGGITLADLDQDGSMEILGGGEEVYALHSDGTEFTDGDGNVLTLGPLTNTGGALFWNTPAVGDLDNDGTLEIAAVAWESEQIYVVDTNGDNRPGWPKSINPLGVLNPNPLGSVVLGDCNADGRLEVFCSVGPNLFGWYEDGTEIIDGDSNPGTDGIFAVTGMSFSYGTPTVADIGGSPYKEVIAGMRDGKLYVFRHDGTPYPGFPFATTGDITSSPVVGDINGDGTVEIVFGTSSDSLLALRHDGSFAPGFPVGVALGEDIDPSPALGDLTGDGKPDVVMGGSNGTLWAFNGATGAALPNFPVSVLDSQGQPVAIRASAVLVDLNNDSSLDILTADMSGRVLAYDANGDFLPGFPIQTGNLIESTPAAWDVDNDGLFEVMVESFDQNIYVWDTPWAFNQGLAVWPMFKRNQRNSGVLDEPVLEVIGEPEAELSPRLLLAQNVPNPMLQTTRIRYTVPAGAKFSQVRLAVFDIQGRLIRELVNGEQPGGVYETAWDGRADSGRRAAAGVYAYKLVVDGRSATRKLIKLD